MEIEDLLDLIELIMTQKDEPGAFAGAISKRKFCFPYFDYLVKEGILPNEEALLAATFINQIKIVEFILETKNIPIERAKHFAYNNGFFDIFKLLLKYKTIPHLIQKHMEINLVDASEKGLTKDVEKIIKFGIDPTFNNNEALQDASYEGHIDVVRLLLKHGACPTSNDNEAIYLASARGHTEIVKLLLNCSDGIYTNDRAIMQAARWGHLEVVRLLLQHGANPTVEDNYPIRIAEWFGRLDIVRLLREYGVR